MYKARGFASSLSLTKNLKDIQIDLATRYLIFFPFSVVFEY